MFKSLLLKVRVLCMLLCCIVSSLAVTAQTKITGHIVGSDDKQPVVGAAIRIKGTTIGTVTDVNGNFTLSATSGQTLVVTYVGYATTEVNVTGAVSYPITLQVNNKSLNEVIVTGYTSQRKKDISGAVAVVNVSDAKNCLQVVLSNYYKARLRVLPCLQPVLLVRQVTCLYVVYQALVTVLHYM
jgi:hypothetical protein